jgi:hypothetical protein
MTKREKNYRKEIYNYLIYTAENLLKCVVNETLAASTSLYLLVTKHSLYIHVQTAAEVSPLTVHLHHNILPPGSPDLSVSTSARRNSRMAVREAELIFHSTKMFIPCQLLIYWKYSRSFYVSLFPTYLIPDFIL